jgi:putative ABC transport system ATP-binding protein
MNHSPKAPLVALEAASRSFDAGRIQALDNVTLGFAPGELVAITGPSGCGKSTLVGLLAGIDQPSEGHVVFDGMRDPSAAAWTDLRAGRIGMVFQDFNLLPTLTGLENVEIALFGSGHRAAERRRLATARLAQLGVVHCAGRLPAECSGSERRRLGIARALAPGPELLLADEPTSNLDSASGRATANLQLELHATGGLTLLVVTHDEALMRRCPRQIRMLDGRVAEDIRSPVEAAA